jgi:hypothetical protein
MERIDDVLPLVPEKVSRTVFADLLEKDEALFSATIFDALQDEYGFVDREALFQHASRSIFSFLPKNELLQWMEDHNIHNETLKNLIEQNSLGKSRMNLCKGALTSSSVKEVSAFIQIMKKISKVELHESFEIMSQYFMGNDQPVVPVREQNNYYINSSSSLQVTLTSEEVSALLGNGEQIFEQEIKSLLTEESYLKLFLYFSFEYLINLCANFRSYYEQYENQEKVAHFSQLVNLLSVASKQFLQSHYQQLLKASLQLQVLQNYYQEKEELAANRCQYASAQGYYQKKQSIQQQLNELQENLTSLPKRVHLYAPYQSNCFENSTVLANMENIFKLLFYTNRIVHLNQHQSIFQIMKMLKLTELFQFFINSESSFSLNYLQNTFSFTVKDYLSFGYQINDIKNAFGSRGIYLLLSYLHSEQETVEVDDENEEGFSLRPVLTLSDLKNADITLEEIRRSNYYESVEEILSLGVYDKENDLLNTFYPLKALLSYGFTLQQIKQAGVYSLESFLQDGSVYLHDLLLPTPSLSYSLSEILATNHYSKDDLKLFLCTNYSLLTEEIKQQFRLHLSFSAKELKDILNLSAKEMYETMGFSLLELIQVRYSIGELLQLPSFKKEDYVNYEYFTLENCRQAGISSEILIEKGYTYDELIESGIMDRPRPVSVAMTVQFFESKASSPLSSRSPSPAFSVGSIRSQPAYENFSKRPLPASPVIKRVTSWKGTKKDYSIAIHQLQQEEEAPYKPVQLAEEKPVVEEVVVQAEEEELKTISLLPVVIEQFEEGETSCSSNASTTSSVGSPKEERPKPLSPTPRRQSITTFDDERFFFSQSRHEEDEMTVEVCRQVQDNLDDLFSEFEEELSRNSHIADGEEDDDHNSMASSHHQQPQYSARTLLLKDIIAGRISMEAIRSHGVSIPELRRLGCKVKDFLKIGFKLQEIKQFPFPINEYKRARIRLNELKAVGCTINDLKRVKSNVLLMTEKTPAVSPKMKSAESFYGAGSVVSGITSGTQTTSIYSYSSYAAMAAAKLASENSSFRMVSSTASSNPSNWSEKGGNMYHNQITPVDLKRAGYTVNDMFKAGYPVVDIKNAGYFLEDIKGTGYTYKELRLAGYSVNELKKVGISAKQ